MLLLRVGGTKNFVMISCLFELLKNISHAQIMKRSPFYNRANVTKESTDDRMNKPMIRQALDLIVIVSYKTLH